MPCLGPSCVLLRFKNDLSCLVMGMIKWFYFTLLNLIHSSGEGGFNVVEAVVDHHVIRVTDNMGIF